MKKQIQFITVENYQDVKLINGVKLHPLKRARRGDFDSRGYLVELARSDWDDFEYGKKPAVMTYSSFTYKGIARDEEQFHTHPGDGVEGGIEQTDRWMFIGRAIVVVADPETKELNLFKIGTGWGDEGFYSLLIPPHKYHGFLSVGGILDDEDREGVWILNWPDNLYNYDHPELIEGRVECKGSGILLPDGQEFSWQSIRDTLGIKQSS